MNPPSYNEVMDQSYSSVHYRKQVVPLNSQIQYNTSNIYTIIKSKKDYYAKYISSTSFKNVNQCDKLLIKQFGKYLGVNLRKYPNLLKYVISAIIEPLPINWQECIDPKGNIYYSNQTLRENQWYHPSDQNYIQIIKEKIKKDKCW